MFEFLFKYPSTVFSRGTLVLLGAWPVWLLIGAIVTAALVLGWLVWRRHRSLGATARSAVIWLLQTALVAMLLLMLWQPALSISTLKPQQNIVAVVIDDSRSMATQEDGGTRRDQVLATLNGGLLKTLRQRFQVRLYRLGDTLERVEKPELVNATAPATRIGENLKQVVAESASLPIGAIVLLSDGADNSGGIDLDTINEIKRHQIPIHTIGYGREQFAHDIEVTDLQVPAKTLAGSRVGAQISFHQRGYSGQKAHLTVKDGSKVLAAQEITFKADGVEQTESVIFSAGQPGARSLEAVVVPLGGEENVKNNAQTRVMDVEGSKPRILYLEGEPRWEYKFVHRAIEDDQTLKLVTILRTTQNKIYRQGIDNEKELQDGFPAKIEELFGYQALIIGSVEANWLTPAQHELIKQFVDRRGGGLLMLGGRFGLSEGGWNKAPFTDLLPVTLPSRKNTYVIAPANAQLTGAGRDSLICRLEDNPDRNVERWKKLPYMLNFQDPGTPKPGALVLADSIPTSGGKLPLLITQNYGRGRTSVLATGGTWRWKMQQPVEDRTHVMFWQQLLRWLVTGTPGHVTATTPKSLLADDTKVRLRGEVWDRTYSPAADSQVEAHIMGPDGTTERVPMSPDPLEPGAYTADWAALKPGSYLAEVVARRGAEEVGRDVVTFRREDGVAENFRLEQNRDLLEKLSSQTGGHYYRPGDVKRLGDDIAYSEAGITIRETKDLWNMPIVFLLVLILRTAEWMLRRKWGVI